MDTLWRTHGFSYADFHAFTFLPKEGENPTIISGIDKDGNYDDGRPFRFRHDNNVLWTTWFAEKGKLYEVNEPESATSILLFPRAQPNIVDRPTNILQSLPVNLQSFRLIVNKFHLHRALSVFLKNGTATFSSIPCTIDNRQCKVYTLCVENGMFEHTALTITHFPKTNDVGSKTYALALGFSAKKIERIRLDLCDSGQRLFSPFTLMKIFLEVEKKERFGAVDTNVTNIRNLIAGYGKIPVGYAPPNSNTSSDKDDPHKLLWLYHEVSHLKNALAAWKAELLEMTEFVEDWAVAAQDSQEIHPNDYLSRLIRDYDARMGKCDVVLLNISLAFQKDTARQARLDTQQMKAIAVLTMVFLPGTFIAILMTVPEFESMKSIETIPEWSWYLILTLPLTTIVLGVYFFYVYMFRPW